MTWHTLGVLTAGFIVAGVVVIVAFLTGWSG